VEIFASQGAPLVSTMQVVNFATGTAGVVDTGDTGGKFAPGVNDTGSKFATVSMTAVANSRLLTP
jgi:hypothetical protein